MNLIPLKAEIVLAKYINREGYNPHVVTNEVFNIKDIINNWDNYNDDKKYRIISKYYDFRYSIDDVFEIINSALDKEYTRIVDISTKMETESVDSKGHDDDFKWWYTYNRVHYICLATNDIKIENKNYSREELTKMIDNNQILPITNYLEILNESSKEKERFKYIRLLLSYGIDISDPLIAMDENGDYIKDKNNNLIIEDGYYDIRVKEEYIPYIVEMIEETITSNTIKKNAYYYLETLIRLIRSEEDARYQKEVKNIKKICAKNPYPRVRSRIKNNEDN